MELAIILPPLIQATHSPYTPFPLFLVSCSIAISFLKGFFLFFPLLWVADSTVQQALIVMEMEQWPDTELSVGVYRGSRSHWRMFGRLCRHALHGNVVGTSPSFPRPRDEYTWTRVCKRVHSLKFAHAPSWRLPPACRLNRAFVTTHTLAHFLLCQSLLVSASFMTAYLCIYFVQVGGS